MLRNDFTMIESDCPFAVRVAVAVVQLMMPAQSASSDNVVMISFGFINWRPKCQGVGVEPT